MKYWTKKRIAAFGLVAMATILEIGIQAQVGDPATLIKEKLVSQIKLTKATSVHDDIVTAGDVVVLHKDGLVMCSSASSYGKSNTYSNGALKADDKNRVKDAGNRLFRSYIPGGGNAADAMNNGCAERKFVAGEKFWVTDISLGKNSIIVSTFSDPYNDVRYYGEITFPFPKGHVPPMDDFVKTVSELITVQPPDDKASSDEDDQASEAAAQAPATHASPPPAPAPMQPIAPPPPPTDAPPPTVETGETKEQVTAAFGQPAKVAKPSPANQIYFYKDMKITFTNGKVSKIE